MEAVPAPEFYSLTDLVPFLAGVPVVAVAWPALVLIGYLGLPGL